MHHEALTETATKLFPYLKNFKGFYLAGGTALALQIGHRVSVDFDFFTKGKLPRGWLSKVEKTFKKQAEVFVNDPDELTMSLDGVKITFARYPFPVLLDLVNIEGVEMLEPREIGATKAYTIGRRGEYKDYVDLYMLLSLKHSTLEEIITLADKKYGDEFNSRLFLEQLIYLDDIEEIELISLKGEISLDHMREFFKEAIKSIAL